MRIGKILEISKHPDADNLYVSQVEVGDSTGPRTIISGLAQLIPASDLHNRLVVVLCNLKPVKMKGIESNGMILCASVAEPRQVEPLDPPADSQPGDRVHVEGCVDSPSGDSKENDQYEILNPKKKVWDKIQADMFTSQKCIAEWKGSPLITSKGDIKCKSLKGAPIK